MSDSQENQTPIDPRSDMSWLRKLVDKGEDPPVIFFFFIAALFLGSGYLLTTMHNDKFEKNVGTVLEKNADWNFVKVDGPGCGDEYSNCKKVTKIHCFADLVVRHNVDGINYTSQINDWFVYSERQHSNATLSCEEFVQNSTLEIGSSIPLFFDKEDPAVAYKEIPYPKTWISYIYFFGIFLSVLWIVIGITFIFQKLSGSNKRQLSDWEKILDEHENKN